MPLPAGWVIITELVTCPLVVCNEVTSVAPPSVEGGTAVR